MAVSKGPPAMYGAAVTMIPISGGHVSFFSRRRRSALAVAVGAAVSLTTPVAQSDAAAAPVTASVARGTCCLEGIKRSFELETPELIFGGYGTADGVVAWQSRRRAVAQAVVVDWCDHNPGDGLGAGLYADIAFGDGTGRLEYLFGDFNGCTNSDSSAITQTHSVPNPQDKRILAVQLLLCYEDPDDAGVACVTQKRSRVIENPHN